MKGRLYLGVCVILLTLIAVSGSSALDGPVVLDLTEDRGLHVGDFFIVGLGVSALRVLASTADHE